MSGDVLVLCYHGVSSSWEDALAVTPEQLREQLTLLADRGYRGIRFDEVLTTRERRAVAVTFDDAYRSVLDLAAPILDDVGMPGTVFAPTAYIGDERPMAWPGIDTFASGPHAHELLPASWDDLRALAVAGWEIGSHTHTHPRLVDVDDATLDTELRSSREQIAAEIGAPCTTIAYPYGSWDRRVAAAAGRAGYAVAGVLDRHASRPTPMAWPRVGVYRGDSLTRFKVKVWRPLRGPLGSAAIVAAKRITGRGGGPSS
jgi:peptidoglycan/xylan/chitin deacetylase (PgdA/CDA1 family)